METWSRLETNVYRTLNRFVEPVVRAGLGSPWLWTSGLVVIETTGRRSGQAYRTPVLATPFCGRVILSTARGRRSQWLKNLAATPELRYWQAGLSHEASALVFTPDNTPQDFDQLPSLLRQIVSCSNALGIGVAVITPRNRRPLF